MLPDSTVFVVDDDPAMCDSIRELLESVDLRVKGFESAEAFLNQYDPARPGCLVLDIRMAGMSGLDLQEQLRARNITIPIIVITGYADVASAVRSFKMGAVDFLEKPFKDDQLLSSIRQALGTDTRAREDQAHRADVEKHFKRLSPRERQVMDFVSVGYPNKKIASELGISQRTVEVHRARVMEKMQAESLAQLVRMALMMQPAKPAS